MTTIHHRSIAALLSGLAAAALITTSGEVASATTVARPTVHAARTTLHVKTTTPVRVGVTARHARPADRLTVQQYYHRGWHPITAYRVPRRSAIMRHTFNLGRTPVGRYLVRVALIRNGRTRAATRRITIYSRAAVPPPPPPPPPPPAS